MSPVFTNASQSLSTQIQKFTYNTKQIEHYIAKLKSPRYSGNQTIRTELYRLIRANVELERQIPSQLTDLADLAEKSEGPINQRTRRNQVKRCRESFTAALEKFEDQKSDIIDHAVDLEIYKRRETTVQFQTSLFTSDAELTHDDYYDASHSSEKNQNQNYKNGASRTLPVPTDLPEVFTVEFEETSEFLADQSSSSAQNKQPNVRTVTAPVTKRRKMVCVVALLAGLFLIGIVIGLSIFFGLRAISRSTP